jgi:hypothetical protein
MNLADSTRVSNLEASSIREALRMIAGEPVENLPRDTDKTRDAVAAARVDRRLQIRHA